MRSAKLANRRHASQPAESIEVRIEHEQLQDLLSLRKFRRSLLIKSNRDFLPQWRAERLTELSYYGDLNSDEEIDLATRNSIAMPCSRSRCRVSVVIGLF